MKLFFLSISLFSFIILSGCAAKQSGSPDIQIQKQIATSSYEVGVDEVDTNDWKLYENEELGVRLKYPQNFNAEELVGSESDFYLAIKLADSKYMTVRIIDIAEELASVGDKIFGTPDLGWTPVEVLKNEYLQTKPLNNQAFVECDKPYRKSLAGKKYMVKLSCESYEGVFTFLQYRIFDGDYYVNGSIEIDYFLKEDGIINEYARDNTEGEEIEKTIMNPELRKQSGKVIGIMETILSSIEFI